MALLHKATITPTKLELLAAWLPSRPWFDGDGSGAVAKVAAARFDDPAGRVGIETMLVRAGDGPVLHVPLTYRDAPLDGAEAYLVGTTDHSVLGKRWVYDATGDPVYLAQLAEVIRSAGHEAAEEFGDGESREPELKLTGSGATVPPVDAVTAHRDGDPTVVEAGDVTLTVNRVPLIAVDPDDAGVLTACWSGQEAPVVLVHLHTR
ncbi:hypothetical protein ACTI_55740 [Actinoplanes sp. OR16]|uniref:CG0192-related protein n=1 Tax=Actinoplanes sp. OR16 TaxID=946334 RepID=UPI000F6EC7D9|nr:hypothetical protein [Actinoplanes sp. OR16]BBH68889.1 hypothetical protein ACTI_55740 [Actinoplanes sp. OR16]